MGQVVVTIAGRVYRMACEDGQEEQLETLARDLDAKMEAMRAGFGEIGEQRLAIMTALSLADELADARLKLARTTREAQALQAEAERLRAGEGADQTRLAAALDAAAARVEALARALNAKP